MLEMLAEYRLEGLVIGLCTFLIIGLYHPLVIKGEYYFGEKVKWWFLVAGIIFLIGSIAVENTFTSALLGVASFSSFWSIKEVSEQVERVRRVGFLQILPVRVNREIKNRICQDLNRTVR